MAKPVGVVDMDQEDQADPASDLEQIATTSKAAKLSPRSKKQKTDVEVVDLVDDEVEDILLSTAGTPLQQQLCLEFMDVTGSDAKTSHFYLESHDWNLPTAVNVYLETVSASPQPIRTAKRHSDSTDDANQQERNSSPDPEVLKSFLSVLTGSDMSAAVDAMSSTSNKRPRLKKPSHAQPERFVYRVAGSKNKTDFPVRTAVNGAGDGASSSSSQPTEQTSFKVLSWNIDGLDDTALENRAMAACTEILRESPDVVFLQEVVPENQGLFGLKLGAKYDVVVGEEQGYFSNILLKKGVVLYESDELIDFGSHEGKSLTRMDRNVVIVKAAFQGLPLTLMTSHLESTKEDMGLRAQQLRICLARMAKEETNRFVIFGGDLNMREADVKTAGGIPKNIVDLWSKCGARKECQNTWDMKRNTNVSAKVNFTGSFTPTCRFDRLYFRPGTPEASLNPTKFCLVGLQKVPNSTWFPSGEITGESILRSIM